MREQRYVVLIVVVLGLGASSSGAAQHPAVVLVSTLQGSFEGVPAQQRGEGVVVEAEAARHGLFLRLGHRGAAQPLAALCQVIASVSLPLAVVLSEFGQCSSLRHSRSKLVIQQCASRPSTASFTIHSAVRA